MADPISLFDAELIPFGLFDSELTAEGWFDSELATYSPSSSPSSVYYLYTLDEGMTWHTQSLIGTGMIDFFTATDHHNNDRVRCWFQYDSGTSGPGKAYAQFRRHTDAAWSATFNFKNSGTAIAVADGCMCNVAVAHSGQNEWVWSPVIDGDSAPTTWFSNDECRTWRQQT